MTEMGMNMDQSTPGGISRRRVLQGAAWSVPAVMVAQVPVWAQAPGTPEDLTVAVTGDVCKLPGEATDTTKGHAFSLSVRNTTMATTLFYKIVAMRVHGTDAVMNPIQTVELNGAPTCTTEPQTKVYELSAGDDLQLAVFTSGYTSSPSGTVEVDYLYGEAANDLSEEGTASRSFTGSPWTAKCRPFGIDKDVWDTSSPCQIY